LPPERVAGPLHPGHDQPTAAGPGAISARRRNRRRVRETAMALDPKIPVLVVDDYGTMVRIIRNLLRQLGFVEVDDAADGTAALEKMNSKRYGLVISDWNMEPMTGFDLLRRVRATPEIQNTPFIMVTAESKTENVIAAKKAGVSNYIVKPFDAHTLKAKIEAIFSDRGAVGSADAR
jgi:two-component system chemotaxis response regulator CheY